MATKLKELPKRNARQLLNTLAKKYPACFKMPKDTPVPLKVGIYQDIRRILPQVTSRELHYALHVYTHRPPYMRVITEGAKRLDLAGRPCGEVTQSEAEHAIAVIASYFKARKARSARKDSHE